MIKAMIFAAGLGTRLYPITADKPKALAEVNGKTLLEHAIDYLYLHGIREIVINTHHFSDLMHRFIHGISRDDLSLHISHEVELLDTAGGLAKARDFFQDATQVVLYNVDIMTNIDLTKMLVEYQEQDADVLLAAQNRQTSRYFLFDDENRLRGWQNIKTGEQILSPGPTLKELKPLAFNGIHILKPSAFPTAVKKLSLTPYYLEVRDKLLIKAFEVDKAVYWFDCGKHETLHQAEQKIKSLS